MKKNTKTLINSLLVTFILVFASYQVVTANLNTGLLLYLPMDYRDLNSTSNANGVASVFDRSGNANNGTLNTTPTNSPVPSIVAGKVDQGLSFDGVTQYVTVNNGASVKNLGAATVMMWVKPMGTLVANKTIYDETINSGGTAARAAIFSNASTAGLMDCRSRVPDSQGSAQIITSVPTAFKSGTWVHVICIFNPGAGNVGSMFLNGLPVSTTGTIAYTASAFDNTTPFSIGIADRSSSPGLNNYQAVIDDVRVYNRALSNDEISQIYRQTAGVHQDSLIGSLLGALGL